MAKCYAARKGVSSVADLRVLSLGAGVQSTTMLLMAATGEFDKKPDIAIFSDTGWEPQHVYDYLEWLIEEVRGIIPVEIVTAGNIREDSLSGKRSALPPFYTRGDDGSEGMLRRQCTREYKIEPINRRIREILGVQRRRIVNAHVEQWLGISLDEPQRMRDSHLKWITNRYPLVEKGMTRYDCLRWMEEKGYPRPPRSSCIGCPYHSNAYWRYMKEHFPADWADAVAYDKQIRNGLRGVRQEAYLHRSRVPLDEVDLRDMAERLDDIGQLHLLNDFDAECEGMCGV